MHEITVTTRNPSGEPGDLGSCESGFFTVDGDLLTVVDGSGIPIRKANGERLTATVKNGESARAVASRLILARWRDTDAASAFNRPIHYRSSGWT